MADIPASGFGKNSAQSIIIDSGVIYKNFKLTDGVFSGDILGATQGGVEINIEKKYRRIEVDGAFRMPVVGTEVVESEEASFTATMLELSADMLRMATGGVKKADAQSGYDLIEGRYTVTEDDYIQGFAITGIQNGTGKHIIFAYDNVLITSATKMKMEDKKEATVEMTGLAHATFEQLQGMQSPWHIYYPSSSSQQSIPNNGK